MSPSVEVTDLEANQIREWFEANTLYVPPQARRFAERLLEDREARKLESRRRLAHQTRMDP